MRIARVLLMTVCVAKVAVLSGVASAQLTVSRDYVGVGIVGHTTRNPIISIRAAAIDASGMSYVLDGGSRRVLAIDRRGQETRQYENDELGLSNPAAIEVVGDKLLILDSPARQLVELDPKSLSRLSSRRLTADVWSFCTMGGLVYLLVDGGNDIVRVIGPDGHFVRAFGTPLGPTTSHARRVLNRGKIACVPERGTVVVYADQLPDVRSYSADGRLVWQVRLPRFVEPPIKAWPTGELQIGTIPGGNFINASLVVLNKDQLLVQTGRLTEESVAIDDLHNVQSVILSLQSGAVLSTQDSVPVIASRAGEFLIASANHPAPSVQVLTFRLDHKGRL